MWMGAGGRWEEGGAERWVEGEREREVLCIYNFSYFYNYEEI